MKRRDKVIACTERLPEDGPNRSSDMVRSEEENKGSAGWNMEKVFSPPPFGHIPDYMPAGGIEALRNPSDGEWDYDKEMPQLEAPGPMLVPPSGCLTGDNRFREREPVMQQPCGRPKQADGKKPGPQQPIWQQSGQQPYIWRQKQDKQGNMPYNNRMTGGAPACGQRMNYQNTGCPLPFYMTYPYPMFGEEEDTVFRDLEYLQQIYPDKARRYQVKISRYLDTMDYDGSLIYDEYPDRLGMHRLAGVIAQSIQKEEVPEAMDSAEMRGQWESDKELIHILMYYEIYRRRHSRGNRWLKF